MSTSRRQFLRRATAGVAAMPFVSGRGLEAGWAEPERIRWADPADLISLDSNENPTGPSSRAMSAIRDAVADGNRYPYELVTALRERAAALHGVTTKEILLGCGSTEHLRMIVEAFATQGSGVVAATPTYEAPLRIASRRGIPVVAPPLTSDLRLDLDAMLAGSGGAGLVYLCNPNNPTGTIRSKSDVDGFIRAVWARSPKATIVVDEAYFEYVEDPAYATVVPLALADPRVLVLRTMSKVYGMAGLRIGYAVGHADVIASLGVHSLGLNINTVGAAGAIASLDDQEHVRKERKRNNEVRASTRTFFERAGYQVADSHTNFLMVDVRQPVADFRKACLDRGVMVGRRFAPLDAHARITIGTKDEMKKALKVFADVLGVSAQAG
ncbi:MAG: pyridoxal phosphate-dependent aminotransferase [Gemmatimonadales bacterium]